MQSTEPFTTVILAGGKSSRMGTDKGLLLFNGKELVSHVIEALKPVSAGMMIISNSDSYSKFGIAVHPDQITEAGPIGGIYTGLIYAPTEWILCVACDMPYLTPALISHLAALRGGYQAVVPFHHENPEPLCALYNRSGIAIFESAIRNGDYKIQRAYARLRYLHADVPESFFAQHNPFSNFNTPGDLLQNP